MPATNIETMGDTDTKKRPLESTVRSSPRLLLHCVDGCVPYLNPNQLEEHFPPSDNTDLWLGLAVRDACVMPIYQSANEKKNEKKRKSNINSANTAHKIRGYTFCPTPPDPWLLPYTRCSVPAFDLSDGEKTKNAGASKNTNNAGASKNTNNALHVWTPHGRQKLTTDLYAKASLEGLQSHHTMSLFDEFDADEFSARRKRKALDRNEEWFRHLVEASKASPVNEGAKAERSLWKPILLPHSIEDSKDEDETTNSTRPKTDADKETIVPSGFAFVGHWRPDLRLNKLVDTTLFDKVPFKAILTTHSLSEILEIASAGVANIIGTSLPQKWAKEKVALGINLTFLESESYKRRKTEESIDQLLLNQDGCMDLSDTRYARDPRPLVPGCDSFVCLDNRFSRAYIHHLVVAKEMVAEILLFGHNLHCMLKLLRCFDGDENQREKVKDAILSQISYGQNKRLSKPIR